MDRTERFYKIDQLLAERLVVPFEDLLAALEVSRATLKRDLLYLRARLNAPIVWDRDARGYRYSGRGGEGAARGGGQFKLPGLWFNAREIHALLTMRHLLASLDQGGLLGPHVQPLMARLNGLMGTADDTAEEVRKRVRILGLAARKMDLDAFERVGSALLRRKRLLITYHARGSNAVSEREVSPLRLVHYRENWYLDAWCHLRRGLRNFSVDAIERAEILEKPARDIAEKSLNQVLGAGYGIFSGGRVRWARLRFTPERARWLTSEQWHPKQKGHLQDDGAYLLELPYADDRELIMDILKYGPDCEVLAPEELRTRVREQAAATLARYQKTADE
ncbi:MAG: WYL domain-containing protein [Pseudomonadota bacterium]|nr:WYL domain-containing protein [Pseudomonadota bacterium]MDP1905986.1 WYL domain-containing protein [Pseudomonadota bacterium]MDP2352436.1 WYL domain-containing protein [Pseudomonadota bacterium]